MQLINCHNITVNNVLMAKGLGLEHAKSSVINNQV